MTPAATTRELNVRALNTFRARARKAPPTRAHRVALFENMLGTVYAVSPAGEVRYFDYDWAAAVAWIGDVKDVRVARFKPGTATGIRRGEDWQTPRVGQLVWFVRTEEERDA